jgi:type II secretory pathway component PulM
MPSKNPERAKALANSYSEATAWLIEQHKDEFNARRREILQSKYHVEWSPPLTQEQKDEQALAELLQRNPALAERLVEKVSADKSGSEPTIKPTDPHS